MASYDQYVFILCLIVVILFTLVFSVMIFWILKQNLRLIRVGAEDEHIYRAHVRETKFGKKTGGFYRVLTGLFVCGILCVFGCAMYMQVMEKQVAVNVPVVRVVYSDSMAKKNNRNEYLFENDLNDQFARFDVVLTRPLPKEEDLKLYDIVVYEIDDVLLIHRIVGIEEPNEKHPDSRLFQLQGDNVARPDSDPVKYEQMRGIYRGEHVKFVGSCVVFLQSPAGYMCFILIVIEMIASPMMEKKLALARKYRLKAILEPKRKKSQEEVAAEQYLKGYNEYFNWQNPYYRDNSAEHAQEGYINETDSDMSHAQDFDDINYEGMNLDTSEGATPIEDFPLMGNKPFEE